MTAEIKITRTATGNIQTLPAHLYHDPSVYEAERKAIFFNQWLLFGHVSLFDAPGKHLTQNIAGWSVFVIRDKQGELKAFHNVCRHRAAPLLQDGPGKTDVLRCLYHGWVYDTEGQLRKAPDFGGDEKTLCSQTALFPVQVKTSNGLVFICMAENPPPFDEALGDLPALVRDLDLAGFKFKEMAFHSLNCNWKTYVENYLEGYHIPVVHPELNKELDMATYQVIPGKQIVRHLSATRTENAVNNGVWFWFWPNATLNIYQNGMNLELVIPTGPETTKLVYCYLFRDLDNEAENRRTIETSFAITQEDIDICEMVQKNLRGGLYVRGELSPRHESGLAYFQALVQEKTGLNV
ncbi:MAG: aromatic ring-hydroxylating oxygenase subunit alpha [Micavibrio sp.]